jgi:hypothetical protein
MKIVEKGNKDSSTPIIRKKKRELKLSFMLNIPILLRVGGLDKRVSNVKEFFCFKRVQMFCGIALDGLATS